MRNLVLLCVSFACTFHGQAQAPDNLKSKVDAFDAYVVKAQMEWQVPGLAVAVVKDGKIILAKGYGVKELGKPAVVNTETLFACASTTKAMTAACMGMLVDEGKLSWDDPVTRHLPDFQLYDPHATREIKIRDLFTHNTGVGNTDFLWTWMDIPSGQVLQKMREVKPSYSLRSSFIYQNIFYLAAGAVIEKVSGKSWGAFIRERLFAPLKMNHTVPYLKEVDVATQAQPHYKIDNKITVIEHTSADEIGPAGSVWSTIADMAQWTQCMLDSSKFEGGRLLTAKTWAEMFKPQVIVPANQFYPTQQLTQPNWTTYSLGWFQHDYKGQKVNFHTGSLAGAIAIHAQLPQERLGIYVFGNYDHAEVRHALVYKAFDHFALGGARDWSIEFLTLYSNLDKARERAERDFEAKRIIGTQASLPLAAYAGKYTNNLFGHLDVAISENQINVIINRVAKATLAHWHYNTFRGEYEKRWWGKANATFHFNAQGEVSAVDFDGVSFSKTP